MTAVMGGGIGGGSVNTGALADGSVTLQKLSTAVQSTLTAIGCVLVQTQIVASSDKQTVTFTGLDAGAVGGYLLVAHGASSRGTPTNLMLSFNADATEAHYYRQFNLQTGATSTVNNLNTGVIASPAANESFAIELLITQQTGVTPRAIGATSYSSGASAVMYNVLIQKTDATTNVTSVAVHDLDGAYIKIGSKFSLYRLV